MPPPPPQPRGTAVPQPPQKSPWLMYICFVILAFIVLMGLIILVTWLVVRPNKVRYSIEYGSISGYNFTKDNHLDANFHFVLRAHNPNSIALIYYDKIDATVSYEDQKLAVTNVPPFYQRRRNVMYLDLDFVSKDYLINGPAAHDLYEEKTDVGLGLKIHAKIRFRCGVFRIRRTLKASCGPVNVPFNKNKGFEKVYCDVDIDN